VSLPLRVYVEPLQASAIQQGILSCISRTPTKDMMSIKNSLSRLFSHTGFILALGFVIGLAFPQGASWTEPAVTPALGVMMTFSMMHISPKAFLDFKRMLLPILASIVMCYVVMSGIFIGLSYLIVQDYELWTGFVILGSVPPAVAVIPYTYALGGNVNYSLVGIVATYLAALFITPLISTSLLGTNVIDPGRLLIILAELIAAPLVVSQLLRRSPAAEGIARASGPIVNVAFFTLMYTITGLNREAFLAQPDTLLRVCGVAFASTFVLTYLVNRLLTSLRVEKHDRISLVLLGTRKNIGLAAALALTFLGSRAAMPAAVVGVFTMFTFIWLSIWVKRWK